ncbi:MAG: hypothetical protein M0Z91_08570 [Actinomycetota bacterium]|nr:hypothetical protein [Actinomycetota bacterium]
MRAYLLTDNAGMPYTFASGPTNADGTPTRQLISFPAPELPPAAPGATMRSAATIPHHDLPGIPVGDRPEFAIRDVGHDMLPGKRWPLRMFEVETGPGTREDRFSPECLYAPSLTVEREVPLDLAFGPNREQVGRYIDMLVTLSEEAWWRLATCVDAESRDPAADDLRNDRRLRLKSHMFDNIRTREPDIWAFAAASFGMAKVAVRLHPMPALLRERFPEAAQRLVENELVEGAWALAVRRGLDPSVFADTLEPVAKVLGPRWENLAPGISLAPPAPGLAGPGQSLQGVEL